MNILYINKTYYPDTYGGIEQYIYQLCQGCSKYDIKSSVLTLSKNIENPVINFKNHVVYRAKMDFEFASTGFSFSYIKKFIELASNADIIHFQFPGPFADIVRFFTKLNKPSLLTYHSDIVKQKYLNKFYAPLRDDFLKSVDCIVATSPNYLRTSEVLNRFKDKVKIVPIGIDRDNYPVPAAECFAKWRDILPDRFFLFIGATRYYKGLSVLLDALQGTEYPLVMVGAGPGDEALQAQARSLGLRNFRFLGALPDEDKMALLRLCYAVILPSNVRTEAFGIALLEGAMCAKPLISAEIGTGTTYINLDGKTGVTVPPNDPPALRSAMRYLWENPETAASMGRRAEERYGEVFTAGRMVESHVRIYGDLFASSRFRRRVS